MSKVLPALQPPEQSQATQALPTACSPTLPCRQLPQPVVALYNWAGEIGTGERGIPSDRPFRKLRQALYLCILGYVDQLGGANPLVAPVGERRYR